MSTTKTGTKTIKSIPLSSKRSQLVTEEVEAPSSPEELVSRGIPKEEEETPRPPAPAPVERLSSMDQLLGMDLKQLRALREVVRSRIQMLEKAEEESRPRVGERVLIQADTKFQGKEGVIIISKKTRAFVQVPGFDQPAYCLHSELVRLPEEKKS